MKNQGPNILWLTYEDTSPQFVSCYGMTPVQTTPHIDALAAEGIRLGRAYAPAPVCSASRTAIITGMCVESLGMGNHRSKYRLPDQVKGFPQILKEQGIYTSNNDKTDYNIENEAEFIKSTWFFSCHVNGKWKRGLRAPELSIHYVINGNRNT